MYPDNVAYPFGGEGYIMIELHYDNPHEIEGKVFFHKPNFIDKQCFSTGTPDSSGLRLWYTKTPREHDAGLLTVGHFVHPYHVIPPNSQNFISTGLLTEQCSKDVSLLSEPE